MPIAALDSSFAFAAGQPNNLPDPPEPGSDPLEQFVGEWQGKGFNAIWVPRSAGSDHFLMLTLTHESLSFTRIQGVIPNRGLAQTDIGMTGVTYMQQISDTEGHGLHVEPGIWAVAPDTTNPEVAASVVRMASIPHGTTMLAQGAASTLTQAELSAMPAASLRPLSLNEGPPLVVGGPVDFAELHLEQQTRHSLSEQ